MRRQGFQLSMRGMLGLVACVAINVWAFKVHAILGIIGLNVTKHVVIAQLCHAVGVNRRPGSQAATGPPAAAGSGPIPSTPA